MQTVKRGAGRPAAAARTAKHAQRNPQPSSHTTDLLKVEAAKAAQMVSDQKDANPYGRMTVPELRARLQTMNGTHHKLGLSRLNKGQLMSAILEAERVAARAAEYEAANAEQDQIAQSEDAPSGAYVPSAPAVVAATEPASATPDGGDPKGRAKADRLQNELYPHGWAFSARNYDGDRVEAVLVRGSEVLTVVWNGGVFNYEETGHLVADRHTKVRNVSAAVRLGQRPAAAAESDLGRVVANKRFKPAVPRGVPANRRKALEGLDLATATTEELLGRLAGMTVEWINRVSHSTEVATISTDPKFFRVDDREDGRVLQFAAGEIVKGRFVGTGFRAARLDQIVRVGGSSRRRAQVAA